MDPICKDYLTRMRELGIEPNFWCSEVYFEFAQFLQYQKDGMLYVRDDRQLVVPPLPVAGPFRADSCRVTESVWADWYGYSPEGGRCERLDYEYFYAAKDLAILSEAPRTFRKHVKRFIRDIDGHPILTPWRHVAGMEERDLLDVVVSNMEETGQDELEDGETIINYVLNSPSVLVLVQEGESRPWAVVGYDGNWKYLNFRYCFTRSGVHPYLQEYVRWRFYGMAYGLGADTVVNDGGCLDRPGLKKFKDRLNPVRVREVMSWEPERIRQ